VKKCPASEQCPQLHNLFQPRIAPGSEEDLLAAPDRARVLQEIARGSVRVMTARTGVTNRGAALGRQSHDMIARQQGHRQ